MIENPTRVARFQLQIIVLVLAAFGVSCSPQIQDLADNAEEGRGTKAYALSEAIFNDDIEAVRGLLAQESPGLDVKVKGGYAALDYAVMYVQPNSLEIIQLLLTEGASPNSFSSTGGTPLHYVAARNFTDRGRLLLEHGAQVDSRSKPDKTLGEAMRESETQKALPSDLRAVNRLVGYTPLYKAVAYGSTDMITLLLDNGADINARSNVGLTPLHEAAFSSKLRSLKLLLEAGADVSARSESGLTSLHVAAVRSKLTSADEINHIRILSVLVKAGADVRAEDTSGLTPLDYATKDGFVERIEYLRRASSN